MLYPQLLIVKRFTPHPLAFLLCNAIFIHLAVFLGALQYLLAFAITASVPIMILIIAGSYTLSNVQHACHHLLVILLLLLHLPQHLHLWPLFVSLLLRNANHATLLSHLLPLSGMYLLQLQLPPRQTPARATQGPANATVSTATSAPAPTAARRITRSMDTNAGGATTSSDRPASMRTQTARRLEIYPADIKDYFDHFYSTPTLDFPVSLPSSAYHAQHAQSAMFTPWLRGITIPDPVSVQSVGAWAGPTITAEQAQLMAQGFLPNPYLDDDDEDDDDYSM